MELLLAIQKYVGKLIEYGYYPKTKKPSLGKLEKLADLCVAGKIRKLTRYVPKDAPIEHKVELYNLQIDIEDILEAEKRAE